MPNRRKATLADIRGPGESPKITSPNTRRFGNNIIRAGRHQPAKDLFDFAGLSDSIARAAEVDAFVIRSQHRVKQDVAERDAERADLAAESAEVAHDLGKTEGPMPTTDVPPSVIIETQGKGEKVTTAPPALQPDLREPREPSETEKEFARLQRERLIPAGANPKVTNFRTQVAGRNAALSIHKSLEAIGPSVSVFVYDPSHPQMGAPRMDLDESIHLVLQQFYKEYPFMNPNAPASQRSKIAWDTAYPSVVESIRSAKDKYKKALDADMAEKIVTHGYIPGLRDAMLHAIGTDHATLDVNPTAEGREDHLKNAAEAMRTQYVDLMRSTGLVPGQGTPTQTDMVIQAAGQALDQIRRDTKTRPAQRIQDSEDLVEAVGEIVVGGVALKDQEAFRAAIEGPVANMVDGANGVVSRSTALIDTKMPSMFARTIEAIRKTTQDGDPLDDNADIMAAYGEEIAAMRQMMKAEDFTTVDMNTWEERAENMRISHTSIWNKHREARSKQLAGIMVETMLRAGDPDMVLEDAQAQFMGNQLTAQGLATVQEKAAEMKDVSEWTKPGTASHTALTPVLALQKSILDLGLPLEQQTAALKKFGSSLMAYNEGLVAAASGAVSQEEKKAAVANYVSGKGAQILQAATTDADRLFEGRREVEGEYQKTPYYRPSKAEVEGIAQEHGRTLANKIVANANRMANVGVVRSQFTRTITSSQAKVAEKIREIAVQGGKGDTKEEEAIESILTRKFEEQFEIRSNKIIRKMLRVPHTDFEAALQLDLDAMAEELIPEIDKAYKDQKLDRKQAMTASMVEQSLKGLEAATSAGEKHEAGRQAYMSMVSEELRVFASDDTTWLEMIDARGAEPFTVTAPLIAGGGRRVVRPAEEARIKFSQYMERVSSRIKESPASDERKKKLLSQVDQLVKGRTIAEVLASTDDDHQPFSTLYVKDIKELEALQKNEDLDAFFEKLDLDPGPEQRRWVQTQENLLRLRGR